MGMMGNSAVLTLFKGSFSVNIKTLALLVKLILLPNKKLFKEF